MPFNIFNRTKSVKNNYNVEVNFNNKAKLEDIKNKILPLDLLAFRGGDIISDIIEMVQSYQLGVGTFTHVGLVITSELFPNGVQVKNGEIIKLDENKIYVLESTFSFNIPPIFESSPNIAREGKLGVQIRNLDEIIPTYLTNDKTYIGWCKLINNPLIKSPNESEDNYQKRKEDIINKFQLIYNEYKDRPYESDLISLFGAMFPMLRKIRSLRDLIYSKIYDILNKYNITEKHGPAGWQFCSELVANVYQAYNIIPSYINPKDVVPIDFFGYDEDGLPIIIESPVFIINKY